MKFTNPFTGKTVDVPHNRPASAIKSVYDQKGSSAFCPAQAPGMKTTSSTDTGLRPGYRRQRARYRAT